MKSAVPAALPSVREADVTDRVGPSLEGFAQFSFASGGNAHSVYHAGRRGDPVVLVLQELPGIAPGLLLFADRLVEAGFQVYLPWLFGPLGRRTPLRNVARLCISREFARLRAGVSAPVTQWLRELASHISDHNGRCLIGAVGMCVTGSFVIPLLLNPRVSHAVAAQPAIPLSLTYLALGFGGTSRQQALNVAQGDIDAVRTRLMRGDARLLAVRCAADRVCPPGKLRRLEQEFPSGLTVREYGKRSDRNSRGERPHATYTKEYRLAPEGNSDALAQQAFAQLLAFLRQGTGPAATPMPI